MSSMFIYETAIMLLDIFVSVANYHCSKVSDIGIDLF